MVLQREVVNIFRGGILELLALTDLKLKRNEISWCRVTSMAIVEENERVSECVAHCFGCV